MRLTFTVILGVILMLAGFWTKIHRGALRPSWMEKIGFAPNDLWVGRFERILFSTFFTDSRRAWLQALVMTLVAVGGAEWVGGSTRAFATFWSIHILTLLGVSLLVVLPLHRLQFSYGSELALVRDVGPSAGYFGSLGFLMVLIPLPWRWGAAAVVFLGLTLVLFMPARDDDPLVKKHADLAHMLAFVLGVLSLVIWPLGH